MIPYIENFYSPEEADALFEYIRVLPYVRPSNARNKTSRLRRLSFPGYSPPLSHRNSPNHEAGYDVRGIIEDAPEEYKELSARFTAYAASVQLPTPINYLSTIGYLSDDRMNFHQHHEDQKREDQTVYLLSLGAMHPISIRSGYTVPGVGRKHPKFTPDRKDDYVIYPAHGSLYVLPDSFNRPGSGDEHQHAVLESTDSSFDGLRISVNCKHIPPGLSPEEMKRACSRPAGRSQSQDGNTLMNPKICPACNMDMSFDVHHLWTHHGVKSLKALTRKTGTSSPASPRVCWGSREDFPDAVYTGRRNWRGKFHYEESPFANNSDDGHGNHRTGEAFREYALEQVYGGATMLMHLKEARGKDLLCPWCRPGEKNCHALVWLELANQPQPEFDKMCADATVHFTALAEKQRAERMNGPVCDSHQDDAPTP